MLEKPSGESFGSGLHKFLELVDAKAICNHFKHFGTEENYKPYSLKINSEYTFVINASFRYNPLNPQGIEFIIVKDLESSARKVVASLEIAIQGDFANVFHRKITTKTQGLSGSEFLAIMESLLSSLKSSGWISVEAIRFDVSQPSVYAWLLQNGYRCASDTGVSFDEIVTLKDGKYIPNTGYFFVTDSFRGSDSRDDFILDGTFVNDDHFDDWKKYLDYDEEERWFYITNPVTLYDIRQAGYIPTITMSKKLK